MFTGERGQNMTGYLDIHETFLFNTSKLSANGKLCVYESKST